MKPAQLNDIFFRLQRQHQHQEQLLLTLLKGHDISASAFKMLPLLLDGVDQQAIAQTQDQVETLLSMGGTSWEKLSRPAAASLISNINQRLIRA